MRAYLWILAGTVAVSLLFQGFDRMEHSYQTSLWTYPLNGRAIDCDPWRQKGQEGMVEFAFRWGGIAPGVFQRWNRIRLGFPARPVTLDVQMEARILQGRVEWDIMILNLVFAVAVAPLGWFFLFGYRVRRARLWAEKGDAEADPL